MDLERFYEGKTDPPLLLRCAVAGGGDKACGNGRRSVGRSRGVVTAAKQMVASGARGQQRGAAAAAGKVAARDVQSAAGGRAGAAATGAMTRGVLVTGTAVEGESDMARRVSVAKAVAAE